VLVEIPGRVPGRGLRFDRYHAVLCFVPPADFVLRAWLAAAAGRRPERRNLGGEWCGWSG
jgi:hypothetical protein